MMDNHHEFKYKTNRRLKANIFSKLFLCWMFPYLSSGRRRELKTEDIFQLASENHSEFLGDKLEKCWIAEVEEAEKKQRRPNFRKVIVKIVGCNYLKCALFSFISNFTSMLQPIVTKLLMYHLDKNSTSTTLEASLYVLLFALVLNLQSLLEIHSKFSLMYIGNRVKTACSALIYSKLLRLPVHTQDPSNRGKIITLLSNDVARFEKAFTYLHVLPTIPIVLIMNAFLVWRLVGVTSLFMILLVTLQIPFQVIIAKCMTKLREKAAQRTDSRLLLMAEIIHGIRVIKMYTWEKPFEQFTLLIRRKELSSITKKLILVTGLKELPRYSICITLYLTIAIMISYEDNKVTSLMIYPLMHYNFNLTNYCISDLYRCFESLAISAASVNRIENFLLLKEVESSKVYSSEKGDVIVYLKNVSVSSPSSNNIIFSKISINILPNKLYAIVGEMGSGKSSLLKLILGELKPQTGQIFNYGNISYANQEPWLFNGSIRSNILFGESFNEEKYHKVISSCALLKDFEQLPHGDKTIVGEQGAALSGGQSDRINLARAVYRNADVYLLDDPLSSIDHYVGKFVFKNCIKGILQKKTVIFVSQKLEYIKKVDEIILINNGRLEYQGDYPNFRKIDFYQYLFKRRELDIIPESTDKEFGRNLISSPVNINNAKENENAYKETDELLKDCKEAAKLKSYENHEENIEKIKQGKIPLSIFKKFYTNKYLIIGSLIFGIITNSSYGMYNFVVQKWSHNQDQNLAITNSTVSNHLFTKSDFSNPQNTLFYIIGGIVITLVISSIMLIFLYIKLHRISCERLYVNMTSSLLRASVQFFDVNDSGRILNRFSQDLDVVDEQIPLLLILILKLVFLYFIFILQIAIDSPYTSILIIISVLLVFKLTLFFGKFIRSLKRLEIRAKGAVLSLSNDTFNGLVTIRSFGAQAMVQKNFSVQQDNYMAACFTSTDIYWMFTLWIAITNNLISVFVAFSLLVLKSTNISNITSATVGFVMFQMNAVHYRIKTSSDTVAQYQSTMTSLERAFEYTNLSQENITEKEYPRKCTASNWPSSGRIQFHNLYLKYSNSIYPVLKNISFVIEPGTKVGIIGRTGAGKSSLIAALLRLAEIEGSIFIDGVDIKSVTLKDLRSSISILPQNPILFSTSLRNNLDPLNLFDDAKIWATLRTVRLDDIFQSLDEELDHKSLSNGQRQLLCLARVILKKNKILILDEATANMDSRTDNLIYSTIKKNFKDCTILMIAHKLNSIIDCDKILVVDAGQIVEYEEPQVLLQRKNGYFYKIWQASTEDVW